MVFECYVELIINLFYNLQASYAVTTKKKTAHGLATRSRIDRLRACVGRLGTLIERITLYLISLGTLLGHPQFQKVDQYPLVRGPRADGITFRVAPLILAYPKV
jgi:hypothetical protein